MWKVDGCGKWMWKVEGGAVPDLTLLVTNRKSHSGFRLFFSPNSTDFQADYITVVEDRDIMSVKYCLPVPVFYFWRKL